jgi:rod shape-determining protein MreC
LAAVIDARRSRFLLLVLLLAHLAVISNQVDGGGGASLLQRGIFSLLSPLQNGVGAVVRGVKGAWSGYVGLRGAREESQRLEERVQYLELLLQERQHQARESERLRDILGLREILPLETVAAEVVSREGLPWYRTLTIDKGRDAGVELEDPVLTPTGVLGRVIERGAHAAKVQLLLDSQSGAGVMIERSRVTGIVSGQVGVEGATASDLVLKYVPETMDVVAGDVVVTSGLDRIYPKGLVVGRVRSVSRGTGLFKEILVEPSARFDQAEEVLVVTGQKASLALDQSVR